LASPAAWPALGCNAFRVAAQTASPSFSEIAC
jgi:hypothetical protein